MARTQFGDATSGTSKPCSGDLRRQKWPGPLWPGTTNSTAGISPHVFHPRASATRHAIVDLQCHAMQCIEKIQIYSWTISTSVFVQVKNRISFELL
jgi:hypothetical protein